MFSIQKKIVIICFLFGSYKK